MIQLGCENSKLFFAEPLWCELKRWQGIKKLKIMRMWFLANNEILRAKTAIEVMAIDHLSGELVMMPQSASVEAEYNEQYILWAGPIMITKYLKKSEPLLSDFTDLHVKTDSSDFSEQDGTVPYPFRHQIEKWMEED